MILPRKGKVTKMNKVDKKALKAAGLITVIALLAFEAVALLVILFDPEGGLLRINLCSPVFHAVTTAAAILFGVSVYIRECRKNKS